MLKVVVGLGIALVTGMFGTQYIPVRRRSRTAGIVFARWRAAPLAVIIAIAAMLLWRPSDVATEE